MNLKSIVLEYNSGNKLVRLGVKIFALGLALFVAFCGGMIHLWFSGFPRTGVPIPLWMSFSMLAGVFGLSVGACCIAIGMKQPEGGGGRGRKKESTRRVRFGAQVA